MESFAYLLVEKGSPFKSGVKVPLTSRGVQIGRVWEQQSPDLAFEDGHISRKHAEISYSEGKFMLQDLPSSRHGTELNGKQMEKGIPYILKHDDKIVLARGAAIIRFCSLTDPGSTQDIEDLLAVEIKNSAPVSGREGLSVDINRREVIIGGKVLEKRIVGYEFELLILLYRNRGKAVSHEEIVDWVWRDIPNKDTIMRQNVATLVHRLRDCLEDEGKNIINIPAFGYRLD
jgi:hypothetical protein